MAGTKQVTLTNLYMVCDDKGNILQNRKKENWHGVTFSVGHMNGTKRILCESCSLEVFEETG